MDVLVGEWEGFGKDFYFSGTDMWLKVGKGKSVVRSQSSGIRWDVLLSLIVLNTPHTLILFLMPILTWSV